MNRYLAIAVLLCGGSWRATAAPAPASNVDKAVANGLAYLKRIQEADGSWQVRGRGNPAVTALALRAFLSAGHIPGEKSSAAKPYGQALVKGIRWILGKQKANGLIAPESSLEMYAHGIATLMLAEAVGKVRDKKLADEIRAALKKAVAVILKAQRQAGLNKGGWRYRVRGTDADVSVTGWQIMALYAARSASCTVPAQCLDLATSYVKRTHDRRTGGFNYTVYGRPTVSCASIGILVLTRSGKERPPEVLKAGAYILKNPLRWRTPHFFYHAYYSARAMSLLGQNYWTAYRPRLYKVLLKNQQKNGSWTDYQYGPAYGTAMAVLALTAERTQPPPRRERRGLTP